MQAFYRVSSKKCHFL
uniref:Uncharacterized protein n=1 Tax=Rhizophora mucronata TaxID=61149 RepID=A0A2P2NDN9_RHIMU